MGESDNAGDTEAAPSPSDAEQAMMALMTTLIAHTADEGDSAGSEADLLGGWRFESQRWLAVVGMGVCGMATDDIRLPEM